MQFVKVGLKWCLVVIFLSFVLFSLYLVIVQCNSYKSWRRFQINRNVDRIFFGLPPGKCLDRRFSITFIVKHTVSIKEHGPKMFLLFSRLIVEKIASFLTYLKSWWKVVWVSEKTCQLVQYWWSYDRMKLKIKFEKSNFFFVTPILSFPNLIF